MISFSKIKSKALDDLNSNWFYGAILCIIVLIINFVVFKVVGLIESTLSSQLAVLLLGVATFVISCPITIGISNVFLNLVNDGKLKLSELFMPYYRMFLPSIFTLATKMAYVMLWTMLLIIPGIIKSISYSQTTYILIENPTLSPNDAITKSRVMMDGFKWTYFKLMISFIGWFVLAILTLGIGFLWLVPYVQTTLANFHNNLKEHHELAGTFSK